MIGKFDWRSVGGRALLAWMVGVASLFAWIDQASAVTETCANLAGKTVRWIVPYSPGGGYDTYSRLLEPYIEDQLGVEIAIMNMPGAGGLVGAKLLSSADPDGLTIGLINATGLLISGLSASDSVPSPIEDFSLLGRLASDQTLWVAAGEQANPIPAILDPSISDDPILFGLTGIGSDDWLAVTVGSELLGLNAEFVVGYKGTQEASMGLFRGEFDAQSLSWGSARNEIESTELRPILQLTGRPIEDHPALEGVPVFGGADGLAAARAASLGNNVKAAQDKADALVDILSAGRMIAAPPGLDWDLTACLEEKIFAAMNDSEFQETARQAKRPLTIARGSVAAKAIRKAERQAVEFLPIIEASIDSLRH